MSPRLDFGMTYDVGSRPLRELYVSVKDASVVDH